MDLTKSTTGHVRPNFFLYPAGSVGDVVHSGVSRPQNVNALFSCSGATGMDSTKRASRHVTLNLCFCIQWDLLVT
jgi:hypothetical protein